MLYTFSNLILLIIKDCPNVNFRTFFELGVVTLSPLKGITQKAASCEKVGYLEIVVMSQDPFFWVLCGSIHVAFRSLSQTFLYFSFLICLEH